MVGAVDSALDAALVYLDKAPCGPDVTKALALAVSLMLLLWPSPYTHTALPSFRPFDCVHVLDVRVCMRVCPSP
jgi:hypothetical protein